MKLGQVSGLFEYTPSLSQIASFLDKKNKKMNWNKLCMSSPCAVQSQLLLHRDYPWCTIVFYVCVTQP